MSYDLAVTKKAMECPSAWEMEAGGPNPPSVGKQSAIIIQKIGLQSGKIYINNRLFSRQPP